jgi:hypothetical protein
MNATMRFIVWGTIPIGSVMGGALATAIPVRAALILAAVATFAAVVPVLASPLRSLRDMPAASGPPDGPADAGADGEGRPASPAASAPTAAGA